ncbi:MAG TPA: SpoIIE family protein phosphatase [Armatimonadota bacterium]|jgi:GAF domain-containing protein/CheY-like chemotaxis protein
MALDVLDQLRILIVDDEPGGLNALGDILEDQNFFVVRAASGREARAALDTQIFDVALLDIRLPDARGTDLLKEIRERNNATRCIMITASPDAEDAINALNDGASAYIQKPVTVPAVMATIDEVVRKYRKSLEERRKLRDLDIVKNIGEAAMELDLGKMLSRVLRAVVDGFEADGGGIMLLDESGESMTCAAQIGMDEASVPGYTALLGEGFVGRVAVQNRVLAVEDIQVIHYRVSPFLEASGIRSALGAPISTPKGLVGVLFVGWTNSRAFAIADSHLLSVLAQRLGLATMNARLYAQEDASKRRAQYLATVSQELNSRIGDVREVVQRVTRLATERLGDGCAIFLKDTETGRLDVIRSYHRQTDVQRILENELRVHPVRLGEGTVGRVALTGECTVTTRAELAAAYPDRPYLLQSPLSSAMAIPLMVHGAIVGVMSCSRMPMQPAYNDDDVALAREFADRAAVAIENARLLQESQAKREELSSLFEMTRLVTSSLQESQVLASLLHGTAQLMGVPASCIVTYSPDTGSVEVNGAVGLDEATASNIAESAFACHARVILNDSEPLCESDLEGHDCQPLQEAARAAGFRALLATGLEMDGKRQGAFFALAGEADPGLCSRGGLFRTLAGLAGVAISNARSFNRESTIAERVQQWILAADNAMEFNGIQLARDYHAALTEARVGGDFYDVFEVGPDQYGIVIGDVSGKGLSAALHTSEVRNTLRAYALLSPEPQEVVSRTNDAVCRLLAPDIFITLFYAVLDARERIITYANAGHDAPLLCRADGRLETFDSTGRALGLLGGAAYAQPSCHLEPGDTLLLYTDGVTEARRGDQFLEAEGVIELLRRHAGGSAEDVVRGIYSDVKDYANGNLHDDIALLALKVTLEG